jgi:hypothetical protein
VVVSVIVSVSVSASASVVDKQGTCLNRVLLLLLLLCHCGGVSERARATAWGRRVGSPSPC